MRNALILVALISACSGDPGSGAESTIDETFTADEAQIRISAQEANTWAVFGLTGALPPGADYVILEEGTDSVLGSGKARESGQFVALIAESVGRPILRPRKDLGTNGPDLPLVRPFADEPLRPIATGQVHLQRDGIKGLWSAATASARVVVGDVDRQVALELNADAAGAFLAELNATDGELVLFQYPAGERGAASAHASWRFDRGGDFAAFVSAAKGSPTGGVVLGLPDATVPESEVRLTRGETAALVGSTSSDGTGGFGFCVDDLTAGQLLSVTAGERAATNKVPATSGLVSVLNPSLSTALFEGKATVKGKVPQAVAHAILVNCATGQWTVAAARNEGDITLLLDAEKTDVLAMVGVGHGGEIGIAAFVRADDVTDEIPTPLPKVAAARLAVSAITDDEVLIVGWADAVGGPVKGRAMLEVRVGTGETVKAIASDAGEVALVVPATAGADLVLTQRIGPFTSEPVVMAATEWNDSLALPAIPGLITAVATSDDTIALRAHPGALEAGRFAVFDDRAREVMINDGGPDGFTVTLPGLDGESAGLMPIVDGEVQGSRFVVRQASPFDTPFMVSGPGKLGCAAGPAIPGGASLSVYAASADGQEATLPVIAHSTGWYAVYETSELGLDPAEIVVKKGAGEARRSIPDVDALDVGKLALAGTSDSVIIGSGGLSIGSDWLIVVAAVDGRIAMSRPPGPAPWTLELGITGATSAFVFAWHIPSGTASACVKRSVTLDLPEPPLVSEVWPDQLLLGKQATIDGVLLTGASVRIGDVSQTITAESDQQLSILISPDTPLGPQKLVVTTIGGEAEVNVTVAAVPIIEDVTPQPLVVGKVVTLSGKHFGATPTVLLGAVVLPTVAVGEGTVTALVIPDVQSGIGSLKLSNELGSDAVSVEVQCLDPVLSGVDPAIALAGDTITLTGDHLYGAQIKIADIIQEIAEVGDTGMKFIVSTQIPTGDHTLKVQTGCGTLTQPITVATALPLIEGTTPEAAVLGKLLSVSGDYLAGATVNLGGKIQVLTIDSKKELSFVVDPGTPLGEQVLSIDTKGGNAWIPLMVVAAPVITDLVPNPVVAGETLLIKGEHLGFATVTVGGETAEVIENTGGQIQAKLSPATPAGLQPVVVTTVAGVATKQVTVIAPPFVEAIDPDPANVGKPLNILGKNLMGSTVKIAGIPHALMDEQPTLLTVMVDLNVPLGQQALSVATNGGDVVKFIVVSQGPDVQEIIPQPLVVGAAFTLKGVRLSSVSKVSIGGVLQNVLSASETEVNGTVVKGTPHGAQSLKVTAANGVDIEMVTVTGPPQVTAVQPNPVVVGQQLTVIGLGLGGATVTVGGVPATITTSSAEQLTATVSLKTPPGSQPVVLTNAAGSGQSSVVVKTLPPQITVVTPKPAFLDEPLVIEGQHLLGATVTVGGIPATLTESTWDKLTVTLGLTTPFADGLTLEVKTPAGTAQTVIEVSDGTPPGPPSISSITPSSAFVGDVVTVTGNNLKNATITVNSVKQTVGVNTNTSQVFALSGKVGAGEQDLVLVTSKGQTSGKLTVEVPAPKIDSVTPQPAQVKGLLTVNGANLEGFTSVTLGGIAQNLFYEIKPDKLVFVILANTPAGPAQLLSVVTPGGTAETTVELEPAPFEQPVVSSIMPQEVHHGDVLTVQGQALLGSTFTIGGVEHTPLFGAVEFQVQLMVSDDVPAGLQSLVAVKSEGTPASGNVTIIPKQPEASLVYTSALSADGQLVVAGLPDSVSPGAAVTATIPGEVVGVTAAADGSFSMILSGLSAGVPIMIEQAVGGALSDTLQRSALEPSEMAPAPPNPLLMRVELGDGSVHVYGPAPAFGPDSGVVFAASEERVGMATAEELHVDPTQGLMVLDAGTPGELVGVFVAGADPDEPASAPVVTFASALDPPLLPSAFSGGLFCLAGLAGAVPMDGIATATLNNGVGEPLPTESELLAISGDAGSFSVAVSVLPGLSNMAQSWTGEIAESPFSADPPLTDAPAIAAEDLIVVAGPQTVTVTVTGMTPDQLLVVMTDAGEAGVATPVGPSATVQLQRVGAKTVWTWVSSLEPSGAVTPCSQSAL